MLMELTQDITFHFLIGFPASGKTTIGKQIALQNGFDFIDLDEQIREKKQQTISEIFSAIGEEGFRVLEQKVLHELCDRLVLPTIIACGGGTPCFFDNHAFMKMKGETIFIDTPFPILLERLKAEKGSRPLIAALSGEEIELNMRELYEKRLSEYLKADVIWEIHS